MTKLSLNLEGDRQVIIRRHFEASVESVYQAHVDPELIQKWMLGPDGWLMPVCQSDPRPGGKIRFEWSDGQGNGFYLTGEYIELDPPNRIVHVERMHIPDPTPDNHIETRFIEDRGRTLLVVTMTLPDTATRKAMIETGMEHGMEVSYARLDAF